MCFLRRRFFNVLSDCKAMEGNDHWDGTILCHMGMLCGIHFKLHTWLVPKKPVTHSFYFERIAGTNKSYPCRIIGHIGTYFTVQNDTHFNDLTATVSLSRHDRSKSNYAKCFRNFYFSQSSKST